MVASEAQKRATAKWSANPGNAHMLRRAKDKYRRSNWERYLEQQRKNNMFAYAKKLGYTSLEEYIYDNSLCCVRKLFLEQSVGRSVKSI